MLVLREPRPAVGQGLDPELVIGVQDLRRHQPALPPQVRGCGGFDHCGAQRGRSTTDRPHPQGQVGDGRADIVGFGDAGVWVSLNNGNGTFQPLQMVVPNFAYSAGGWRVERHPRLVAGKGAIGQ